MRHIVIKVERTSYSAQCPEMLVAIPAPRVSFHGITGVSFPHPSGGWCVGTKVGEVDIEREA